MLMPPLVGVYSLGGGGLQFVTEGHSGVTHLVFSADGNCLYSGGRKVREYCEDD